MTVQQVKDIVGVFESAFKTVAIIVAGCWTYSLFIRNRQKYPRAKIEHAVTRLPMPNGNSLFRLELRVTNMSTVLLKIANVTINLRQIRPWPPDLLVAEPLVPEKRAEFNWPLLRKGAWDWINAPREIEPGESDSYFFDFVLDPQTETVLVWSFLKNVHKKSIGSSALARNDPTLLAKTDPAPLANRYGSPRARSVFADGQVLFRNTGKAGSNTWDQVSSCELSTLRASGGR